MALNVAPKAVEMSKTGPAHAVLPAPADAEREPDSPMWRAVNSAFPRLLHAASVITYRFLLVLLSFLPLKWACRAARSLGRLTYRRRRRKYTSEIAIMGPRLGLSPLQAESAVERHFELAACEDMEAFLYPRLAEATVRNVMEVRGLENLQRALARGKGAIVCSGHLKGFATFAVALSLHGYKINHTHRVDPLGPQGLALEHWFFLWRQAILEKKFRIRFLLASPTNPWVALQGLNVLRKNEVLFMLFDAPSTTRNIEVNFLGRRVAFPSGPAVLAKKSGAPLLNFYVYRTNAWVPQIAEIGTPYYVDDDIAAAVQHYVSCLEDKILQHPANWCTWLAREWRVEKGFIE